jgi:hypothetical protein
MEYPRQALSERDVPWILQPQGGRARIFWRGQPQMTGYTPAEITAAYGLNAITFTTRTQEAPFL